MTNHTDPFLADLLAWQAAQNPLVRDFTESLVELTIRAVHHLQSVIEGLEVDKRSLRQRLASLENEMAAKEADEAVKLRVAQDRIDQLERRLFGPKAERPNRMKDGKDQARARRRNELTEEQRKALRAQAAKRRQEKLDGLPTETLEIPLVLTEAERAASRPLPALESTVYEWRPGHIVRILVRREQRAFADDRVITAPPPPQVIEGGSYGPALHAKVAMDKCLTRVPLRGQERAFERLGAPIPASVLCAMFHRSANGVEAIYKVLIGLVAKSPHVSADETPQPVLDEGKTRKGWMWVFASDEVILFSYASSRGGAVAQTVLGSSPGTLTVDGHTGYNLVTGAGQRERGGCWSHARRGVFEAQLHDEVRAAELLDLIGELFYTEQLAIEDGIVGTDQHLALRQVRSGPVVERLFAAVEAAVAEVPDARSSWAKALKYILNQRVPLTLFLRDPRVPIHNNLSERQLRVVALLRKISLFVGHDEAGRNLAMLLTMAATCQLHGVNPEAWLADVLIRVGEPGSTVDELLPWVWKTRRGLNPTRLLAARQVGMQAT